MIVRFRCYHEAQPGNRWKESFEKTWPHYRNWYLMEGNVRRPGYLTSRNALAKYMPELLDIYDRLCKLAGSGDVTARFLSLYNPPPFMSGCTQLVWLNDPNALVRNYDYNPKWFEGVMLYSDWIRPVMGIIDCSWGVLDGMNADGLCASLAFGGRKVTGTGFGIPLVLRYILETCTSVDEAVETLRRVPVHMAYNVVLLDRKGNHTTAFLGPDRKPGFLQAQVSSNHQENIDWPEYAVATTTVEREARARELASDRGQSVESLLREFLQPPLYNSNFEKSFGTLYTSAWIPSRKCVEVCWPQARLQQSFEGFEDKQIVVELRPHAGVQTVG